MTDLSRDARSLVARARVHEGPSAHDRARIRARLEPAWAAGLAADEAASAASTSFRAALRRVPIAKALVLLAVASWSPSQPSAAGEPAPVAASEVAAPAPPAFERARRAITSSDPASEVRVAANGTEPSPPVSEATPRHVQASGQLPSLRRHGGAPARSALTRNRAREPEPKNSAEGRRPRDLDYPTASGRPSATVADVHAGTPNGPAGATRTPPEASRPPSARPNAATLAVVTPQNQAAPTQSRTEFKPQAIDDELAWIGEAQEALQNHKPSQALRLVEQHAFRFPAGALTQERLVVHTLALCALERFAAARRMLEVLEERAPGAPIVARVRTNCGL
jgi:hypothetical protein